MTGGLIGCDPWLIPILRSEAATDALVVSGSLRVLRRAPGQVLRFDRFAGEGPPLLTDSARRVATSLEGVRRKRGVDRWSFDGAAAGKDLTMESAWREFRHALRNLRQSPGFTLVTVATLALGIGANVAIFTVAKSVLLDPLPYPEPERVMVIQESNPSAGFPRFSVSPLDYLDFHDRNQTFEAMAAVSGASFALTGGDQPQRLRGVRVTGEYFDVYGIRPVLGKVITPENDTVGAERVVVLGHGFWQRRFGGDPAILDRLLTLDGESYRVIGVLPEGIQDTRDVFVPQAVDYQETDRGSHY